MAGHGRCLDADRAVASGHATSLGGLGYVLGHRGGDVAVECAGDDYSASSSSSETIEAIARAAASFISSLILSLIHI